MDSDEDLANWREICVSSLAIGMIVQDLGMVEDITEDGIPGSPSARFEVDMWAINRGGSMRRWRPDHRVMVKVDG